jgi:hypothetical protein
MACYQIDDLVKRAEIQSKCADIDDKKQRQIIDRQRLALDKNRLMLDKVTQLSNIIGDITVEEDAKPGMEPKWKPVYDEEEIKFLKKTLMKLIKRL